MLWRAGKTQQPNNIQFSMTNYQSIINEPLIKHGAPLIENWKIKSLIDN